MTRATLPRASLPIVALAFALLGTMTTPSFADDPTGLWINKAGDTKIRVTKCGTGLCGKVAWLGKPNDASGRPKTDRHNQNASQRSRPLRCSRVRSAT